ncbi:histidine phosphotransferase family protein [Roseovarius sp. EL26]|uniref:histidine phosphotransferase family protein n=1 Tax=Roseovarius sp. EL26 TaxID=2126672 RepID=UPI000EA019EF|nr:histidine phosphotransferase family protein [Roseovarius sp. EL26]
MYDSLEIATLVGSRLCHDFASPIGSVSNGLELLGLSDTVSGPEYDLTMESAHHIIARLTVYRIAFGAARDGQVALTSLVHENMHHVVNERTTVTCGIQGPVDRKQAQVLLLASLCLNKALPHGGEITLCDTSHQYQIVAKASTIMHDTAHWDSLRSGQPLNDLQASHVEFGLLPLSLAAQGLPLQVSYSSGQLMIGITHSTVMPSKVRRAPFRLRRQDT